MEKQNKNSKIHMEMIVVCIIIFIVSHLGLEFWKKNYTRSYNVSLQVSTLHFFM